VKSIAEGDKGFINQVIYIDQSIVGGGRHLTVLKRKDDRVRFVS